jgi:hypothetical protein
MNSDSDSDDDIFLDKVNQENGETNVNGETNGDIFYQLQHKSDDIFTFKAMGYFEHEPVVSLGNFNSEGKSFYLESNFIRKEEINGGVNGDINGVIIETNKNFYPMMSIYINNSGQLIRVVTGIELKVNPADIEVDKDYTGLAYIELVDQEKNYREIIKKGLIFPGSTKIVYFLIRELSNEKISSYINGNTDK